jgi:acetyl esterase/lipase
VSDTTQPTTYIRTLLDQADADVLARLEAIGEFSVGEHNLQAVRSRPARAAAPLSDEVERTDRLAPASDGHKVPVRVHRPRGVEGPLPCVYSIHGGGYVFGSNTRDDALFDRWCPQLGCVGVSVDYRLAPETPFPGPLEDCYTGLRWVHEHAGELGVDPDRVGITGDSAGGGLAAALALLARDRGELPVAFQLLRYPALDDRQTTPSSQADAPLANAQTLRFAWTSYLGSLYATDEVPGYAAPARATDLAGLPPALIVVGAIDSLLDEGIAYAQALTAAGVPTDLHVLGGATHMFDALMRETAVARRGRQTIDAWVDAQLHRTAPIRPPRGGAREQG